MTSRRLRILIRTTKMSTGPTTTRTTTTIIIRTTTMTITTIVIATTRPATTILLAVNQNRSVQCLQARPPLKRENQLLFVGPLSMQTLRHSQTTAVYQPVVLAPSLLETIPRIPLRYGATVAAKTPVLFTLM